MFSLQKNLDFEIIVKKFRLANCQFSRLNVVSMVEDRLRQDFDNFRQFRGWGILSTGMGGGIFFLQVWFVFIEEDTISILISICSLSFS